MKKAVMNGANRPSGACAARRSGRSGRARRIGFGAAATLAMLAFAATPALAVTGHGYSSAFGEPCTATPCGPGQLKDPTGVAVSETGATKGDVYVVDSGDNRVEVFSEKGEYLSEFNGTDSPQEVGALEEPQAIAIDNSCALRKLAEPKCKEEDPSNGDVYVSTHDSSIGYNPNNGELATVVDKFSASGAYMGQLNEGMGSEYGRMLGVSVDANGLVWTSRYGAAVNTGIEGIHDFSNALTNQVIGYRAIPTAFGAVASFAVDSEDNIYISTTGVGKFNSDGEAIVASRFGESGDLVAVSVDLASNDVYIDSGTAVEEAEPDGAVIQKASGAGHLAAGAGVGVDSSSDTVYVADSASDDVVVLTPGPTPPAPNTDAVSEVTATTATLNGDLEPKGSPTDYYFSYDKGASCAGEGAITTPLDPPNGPGHPAAGNTDEKASADITGLEPNASYAVCFVAENEYGPTYGSPVAIKTHSVAPEIAWEGESASPVTPFEATLHAQVNADNQESTVYFQYSTSPAVSAGGALSSATPVPPGAPGSSIGSGFGNVAVEAATGGVLAVDTPYYYQAVATNATGVSYGHVERFVTLALEPPAILAESVSGVTTSGATLEAQVGPGYQETTCEFRYGTEPSLATSTTVPCSPEHLGSGGEAPASAVVGGLAVGTTYYYRVVAENGTPPASEGKVEHFTTEGTAPLASTGATSALGQNSVNVTGTVNPNGVETFYYYQYGPTAEYGQSTTPEGEPGVAVGMGTSAVEAPGKLVPLTPGVTYHYRLVAWNVDGTSYGKDETFATPAGEGPLASTGPAGGVSDEEATLSGTVDPRGKETDYRFEYGTDTGYGTQAFGTVLPEQGVQTVTLSLRGLDPGTTYHYRLVASNPGGAAEGEDETFTTPGILDPLVFPVSAPLIGEPPVAFPSGSQANTGTSAQPKKLTNAEKLSKALRVCRAKKGRRRAGCEKAARKQYGPVQKRGARKKR
jgi:hypothetical protein